MCLPTRSELASSVAAYLGPFGAATLAAVCHPLLPEATRYAVDALERSAHSLHFCHHARPAPLPAEGAFVQARDGRFPRALRA